MGEVYKARDTRLQRTVAIKVLPEGASPDSDARRRFAARSPDDLGVERSPHRRDLRHRRRGPARIHRHGARGGRDPPRPLGAGRIEIRQALEFAAQAASGLAAAHGAGIIHRDIKPENLMVAKNSQVKILDFGLAKLEEKEAVLASTELTAAEPASGGQVQTARGMILGTVAYMSPEQAAGRAVDSRTDILSRSGPLRAADRAAGVLRRLGGRRSPRDHQRRAAAGAGTEPATVPRGDRNPRQGPGQGPGRPLPARRGPRARSAPRPPRSRIRSVSAAAAPAPRTASRRRVFVWTAAVVGLIASAFGGWWMGRSRTSLPETSTFGEETLTSFTTDPGYEGEPTFSPDGQTIAYVADREGNFEIYLQQIGGGPALNLTRNAAADIQPSFSPDGREIAFVSDRSGGSIIIHASPNLPQVGGDIWIMPALGGPARRIVESAYCPSWTPDGSGLLYVHGTFRNTRIARVPSAGGECRDVPIEEPVVFRYFFPSLSEDGRWLLYQNGGQVEVVAAEGGKPRVLAQGAYPAWERGSTSILFTNESPGKGRSLWRAGFSLARGELAGPPRPLTFGRGADLGAGPRETGRRSRSPRWTLR